MCVGLGGIKVDNRFSCTENFIEDKKFQVMLDEEIVVEAKNGNV